MPTAEKITACKDSGGLWLKSSYKCKYTGSIDLRPDECQTFDGVWNDDKKRCDYPLRDKRVAGMIHETDHLRIFGRYNREPYVDALSQFIEMPLGVKNYGLSPRKSSFYKVSKPINGEYKLDELKHALCQFENLSCTHLDPTVDDPFCHYFETHLVETNIYVNEDAVIRKFPVFLNVKAQCAVKITAEKKLPSTPLISS